MLYIDGLNGARYEALSDHNFSSNLNESKTIL
jgi:hypothetical protein